MGLIEGGSATYLNIVKGRFAIRVKEKTAKSVTRTLTTGAVVEELYYKAIIGRITGMDIKHHDEYGDSLLIYLEDGDRLYCIQFRFDGQYGNAFLKTLPNIDLTKELELIPSQKIENDKERQTLFIKQNGHVLKRALTKDSTDMPQPKEVEFGGKTKWDYYPQIKWLKENVYQEAVNFLKKNGHVAPPSNAEGKSDIPTGDDSPVDDLPF
jgi:hypothetical protein